MKMNIQSTPLATVQEPAKLLKSVAPGTMIRFAHDTYDEALKNSLFYLVLQNVNKRVKLVSLDAAEIIERDEDFRVIEHQSTLYIHPNN